MAAQSVNVTKGVGVKEGVKVGVGMFVILPILLLFGSCAACISCFGVASMQYDQVKKEHQQKMMYTQP